MVLPPSKMDRSGTSCGVKTCTSCYQTTKDLTGDDSITYFRIPRTNEQIRLKWLDACEKQNVQYVCSLHFEPKLLIRDEITNSVSLVPGSIPTLKLPKSNQINRPVAKKSTGPAILKKDKNDKMDIEEELALMEKESDDEVIELPKKPDKLPEAYVLVSKCEIPENAKIMENKTCCVIDCRNKENSGKKLLFHSFPRDAATRRKWISWTKVNSKRADFYYICSEHFTLADYYDNNGLLRWYAVPSKKPIQEDLNKSETSEKSRSRLKSTHVVRQEFESEPEAKTPKKVVKKKEDDRKKPKLSGIRCAVQGCYTKQGDGLYFYPFPNEKPVRTAWLTASKFNGTMTDTTAICSKHFMSKDFVPMPGSILPSTRLRRGTIPSKYLPSGVKNYRKRKILKESSSEDDDDPESFLDSLPPEVRRGLEPTKKDKKLTKKIEIIAEFDEENDGSLKKNYKVVIKKIKRKGPEGERKRGLLVDCKNSLILVKKIIEGLDITRMEEIKFKPGAVEESRVVLSGNAGTIESSNIKNGQNYIRIQGQQSSNSVQQVYIVNQPQPIQLPPTTPVIQQHMFNASPGTSKIQNIKENEDNFIIMDKPNIVETKKQNPEEFTKIEEEMTKCHLSFELQRYKTSAQKQSEKIKILQQTKKRLEKRCNNIKKMVEIARKGNFMTVFQDSSTDAS